VPCSRVEKKDQVPATFAEVLELAVGRMALPSSLVTGAKVFSQQSPQSLLDYQESVVALNVW
jgi:hypothetical protein